MTVVVGCGAGFSGDRTDAARLGRWSMPSCLMMPHVR